VLISDSGSIFKAKAAMAIYAALGIEKKQIERGQAWQNYIETTFNILRRMADYHLARAETWDDLRSVHERFFADYNYQDHWAHRKRNDGHRSPAAVLGWVHGRWCEDAQLDRIFRLRADRRLDPFGYVRYRCWRIYAERGLAGRRAAVWLFGETLTLEFKEEALAQYQVAYEPDERHIRQITTPLLFEHRFPALQPFLCDVSDVPWHMVRRMPPPAARRTRPAEAAQLPLFP
jgi:hypothetical protein